MFNNTIAGRRRTLLLKQMLLRLSGSFDRLGCRFCIAKHIPVVQPEHQRIPVSLENTHLCRWNGMHNEKRRKTWCYLPLDRKASLVLSNVYSIYQSRFTMYTAGFFFFFFFYHVVCFSDPDCVFASICLSVCSSSLSILTSPILEFPTHPSSPRSY